MNIRKNQRGYTVTELLICIAAGSTLILAIGVVYTIVHFLAKVW